MATPIWLTPAGSLGTIQEQVFFELLIEAYDPERLNSGLIKYNIIAGSLPPGLTLFNDGTIRGISSESYFLKGVPFDVTQDITSTFCVRATDHFTGRITDRTFSITVTGEDPPVISTEPGLIGSYLDGTKVELQLEAYDLDNEPITWQLTKGSLPPGLTLDTQTGLITGFIGITPPNELAGQVGWSAGSTWDQDPWDYGSKASSLSYQFSVQATDGKTYDGATYRIFVYSQDALTADNSFIFADHDAIISADMDIKRNPVLLTEPDDLGVYVHDNYFAYRFLGKDFDGDEISFSILLGENIGYDNEDNGYDSTLMDTGNFVLPPGLVLNTETGWLYGQIPGQIAGQTEYTFAVRVYKTDYPDYKSGLSFFTLTIINDLRYLINWSVNSNLGTIATGSISEKYIAATNPLGRSLTFSLHSGRLPQGLNLLTDGLIVGRSSFETTSFDEDTTTFDKNVRGIDAIIAETTLDREFTFTVKASDANGEMISYKTFTLEIDPSSFGPYESLYLRAQPDVEDRELLNLIFRNSDILPADSIYRSSDPNFGRSKDLRMLLASGLKASTPGDYMEAMATNHYRKALRLGAYTWARALDENDNHIYDAVYIEVIDDLSISNTKTAPQSINLNGKINIDGDKIVYPNSLLNMRSVIRNEIGLETKEPLPKWMSSKQDDGRILGWTPSIIVAYVKPGHGDKVIFNLNRLGNLDIKLVDFDTDRYIWDTNLSKNWNVEQQDYETSTLTTFDAIINPSAIVTTVDYALDVPFSHVDGQTVAYLDSVNGFDGIIDTYVGKRIIFAKQENYSGFTGEYDGWVRYDSIWDDSYGWSNPESSWDSYEVIPGYNEADGSTINQRAAVWLVTRGADNEIRLVLDTLIGIGDKVEVRYGTKYGGFIVRYGPNILFSENKTVPDYDKFDVNAKDNETIFDSNNTRFIDSISVYQEPDEGDKYLAYPRTNIWA